MNKMRLILFSATGLLGYLVITGWAGGPAHSGVLLNGTPGVSSTGTCRNCHAGNNGTTTINSVRFTDNATRTVITDGKYKPGHEYTVEINATGNGTQSSYGFQANFRTGANSNAGTLATNISNTGVAAADGYSVVEHTARIAAAQGSFTPTFKWTAPAAGTGAVTLHAIVNAVNGDRNVSGDAVSNPFTTTLAEASTTSVTGLDDEVIKIFPNPASANLHIHFKAAEKGNILLLNTVGQVVQQQITEGSNEVTLAIGALPAGFYYVQYLSAGQSGIASFIKQ